MLAYPGPSLSLESWLDHSVAFELCSCAWASFEQARRPSSRATPPFFKGKRANYYINKFVGGYSQDNRRRSTVVVSPNGTVRKSIYFGLFSISPKVKKGSAIMVYNKEVEKIEKNAEPINWNEAIENTLLKVTALITLWVLADKIATSE